MIIIPKQTVYLELGDTSKFLRYQYNYSQYIQIVLTYLLQDNDERGFEKAYEQAVRCAKGFLEQLDKGNVKY